MRIILLITVFLIQLCAFGQPYQGAKSNPSSNISKSAGCIPPTTSTYMELNNVRMLVHTAGNLWQVTGQNYSMYEVPKNSGIMCLFTGSLWLGGTDLSGQLKLAALRYRDGQDYWNGPLTQSFAEISAEECLKYDRHFVTKQDDVRQFKSWYDAGEYDQQNGTSTQSTLFPNYQIPQIIKDWPAHGDISQGQDYYLAPFFDRDEDGTYNWEQGDYPWYDLTKSKVCNVDRQVSLYGDLNYWWVMNDKGNIHTETLSDPIGMEIRAQAFVFASNDEINNMTFYNYELINRGTQTLANTYFGSFTDGALGNPYDDFVGCDVQRGLGYYYNGNNYDADNAGYRGYGNSPPAVGVDFFEGPYQDNDSIDNAYGIGPNEALNGIGYGDGIVDNERYGMRRFLYYSNTTNGANPSQTDPIFAIDYYNYLRGIWKDGSPFFYGGSGHNSDPQANTTMPCDFMFPGDSDPLGWGTGGLPQAPWTELTAGNVPNDRRFVQSAGPFMLLPGAVNNITVGVVWARSSLGDPFASVEVLKRADDKAQALFDNCFRVLEGPHSPDLTVQEMANSLILYINNPPNSNNYNEEYVEFDPFIVAEDSTADKFYKFQGYQIYQLINDEISASELEDASKARIVAQCDIKDGVGSIINFEYDAALASSIPVQKVVASNTGINHSFLMTEDQFASGDRRLINFKRYYYIAIAYAHNNFKTYNPNNANDLDGQKTPYLPSRKAAFGEVKAVSGVPHNPMPEAGGTYYFVEFGSSPFITRIDGTGNGNRELELTPESTSYILENGFMATPTYAKGKSPIHVKVIDPLNIVDGYFELKYRDYTVQTNSNEQDTASWTIYHYETFNGPIIDSIKSDKTIKNNNEQLIPQWGISVQIHQSEYYFMQGTGTPNNKITDPISSSISFSDSTKKWLTFNGDQDAFNATNWIGSGTLAPDPTMCATNPGNLECIYKDLGDPAQVFERIVNGGVGPHQLVRHGISGMPIAYHPNAQLNSSLYRKNASISYLPSVDIVLTKDKSKWTRCPIVELGFTAGLNVGNAQPGELRKSPSVDKNGNPDGTGNGMGWFPGYAIDLETGARLYMAFGENSFLGNQNGADMLWNPTSKLQDGNGNIVSGGQHAIWVFGSAMKTINAYNLLVDIPYYVPNTPNYLEQQFAILSSSTSSTSDKSLAGRAIYGNLFWIANPILSTGHQLLESDVTMRVRMNKEYKNFVASNENGGKPMYAWNMSNESTQTRKPNALAEALQLINVVPNPYYAFSEYERNRIDTRVKITNLPETCTIKIFNTTGKLVKEFKKDSPQTWIDWTLVNHVNIPIASGVYFIHVAVPDVGEVVLKSFIGMRQVDLQGL